MNRYKVTIVYEHTLEAHSEFHAEAAVDSMVRLGQLHAQTTITNLTQRGKPQTHTTFILKSENSTAVCDNNPDLPTLI